MFLGPVLVVALLHAGLYFGVLAPRGMLNAGSRNVPFMIVGHNLTWMVALWTLAWVGLAASLTAKGLTRAVFKSFLIGFLLPLILTVMVTSSIETAFAAPGSAAEEGLWPYWDLAIRTGFSMAVVFLYAWRTLYGQFRGLVAPGEHQPKAA